MPAVDKVYVLLGKKAVKKLKMLLPLVLKKPKNLIKPDLNNLKNFNNKLFEAAKNEDVLLINNSLVCFTIAVLPACLPYACVVLEES